MTQIGSIDSPAREGTELAPSTYIVEQAANPKQKKSLMERRLSQKKVFPLSSGDLGGQRRRKSRPLLTSSPAPKRKTFQGPPLLSIRTHGGASTKIKCDTAKYNGGRHKKRSFSNHPMVRVDFLVSLVRTPTPLLP